MSSIVHNTRDVINCVHILSLPLPYELAIDMLSHLTQTSITIVFEKKAGLETTATLASLDLCTLMCYTFLFLLYVKARFRRPSYAFCSQP